MINIYADADYGNDSGAGTQMRPVKTLAEVQTLARAAAAESADDITVWLKPGTYTLPRPLSFDGTKDNPHAGKTVTYKNSGEGKVYVSGGHPLGGWTEVGGGVVKTSVPPGFDTRDLYVNGKPAIRARTPVLKGDRVTWEGINSPIIRFRDGGKLAEAANPRDVEIVFNYWWMVNRVGVASISKDGDHSVLVIEPVDFELLRMTDVGNNSDVEDNAYNANRIWWIENSMDFLDEPGEFYFDRTQRVVYYKLRDSEKADGIRAVAGMLEQLVVSTGDERLRNITFEGLTFCDTTWLLPDQIGGHCIMQAGFYFVPDLTNGEWANKNRWLRTLPAIQMTRTDGIRFLNNDFINLGNGAIDMEWARNTIIKGNLFTDCGGSAVVLGSWDTDRYQHTDDIEIITENCDISDNYIHHICTNSLSSCGISVGYSRNITVDHNTIHDLPYTGISYGWGWGALQEDFESMSKGGSISGNEIHSVMQTAIDGGGIYTLSSRIGLMIRDNYVHDIANPFGSIYLDNSSEGYLVSDNVLRRHTGEKAAHLLLTCYSCVVENNYMDDTAGVYYIGFNDESGRPVNTMGKGDQKIYWLTLDEWKLRNNVFRQAPYGAAEASEKIIEASGVRAQYRRRFQNFERVGGNGQG